MMIENNQKTAYGKALIDARKAAINRLNHEKRIQWVASVKGVNFLLDNFGYDLKGTKESLQHLEGPVVWIFSNQEIAKYYNDFSDLVADRVKAVIALNRSSDDLLHYFKNDVDFFADAKNMQIAVRTAFSLSQVGDLILFSPGEMLGESSPDWDAFVSSFQNEVLALVD